MKITTPLKPVYIFTYPNLGYSIQIVPHTPADSAKIKRAARAQALVVTGLHPR
ncbi:MAG TPA: hypothetical protein VN957_18555 [Chthoniobacterales bacterium]|nr:hypothetical protein [Chthoniobacterales bacterium]